MVFLYAYLIGCLFAIVTILSDFDNFLEQIDEASEEEGLTTIFSKRAVRIAMIIVFVFMSWYLIYMIVRDHISGAK